MTTLRQRIPDPAVLTSLAPEELASQLLSTLQTRMQSGMFHRDDTGRLAADYPDQRQGEVELAITEAWRWLEINMFILPAGDGHAGLAPAAHRRRPQAQAGRAMTDPTAPGAGIITLPSEGSTDDQGRIRPPTGWGNDKLTDFHSQAFHNSLATYVQMRPGVDVLIDVDSLFHTAADNLRNPPDFLGAMLPRSHSAYRAASRLAMSGEAAETFPLLRACLVGKRPVAFT